jgi:hypothetical protein
VYCFHNGFGVKRGVSLRVKRPEHETGHPHQLKYTII